MMSVVKVVAQIAAGIVVGNMAHDATNSYVVEPIKKVIKSKKAKKES